MKKSKNYSRLLTMILLFAMIAGITPIPVSADSAAAIETYINGLGANGYGASSTGSLSANAVGNTVTVTGEVTGAELEIALNIDSGVTVVWDAIYDGNGGTSDNLIRINSNGGGGTFEVPQGGVIRAHDARNYIIAINNVGACRIVINGGEVSAENNHSNGSSVAIYSDIGNITVKNGSTIKAFGKYQNTAISPGNSALSLNIEDSTIIACGGDGFNRAVYYNGAVDVDVSVKDSAILAYGGGGTNHAFFAYSHKLTVTVDGGIVLGYEGNDKNNLLGNDTGGDVTFNIAANSAVILWNGLSGTYDAGNTVGLVVTPNGYTAKWDKVNGKSGIAYIETANPANTGFIALPVTVSVPPAITTASLPNGTVGTVYSQTLTATGDTPITWSIVSGNLPNGLSLSGDTISGTPSTAGTFNFTVIATNGAGNDTKALSITISDSPPVSVTSVTLNKSSTSLTVGDTETLIATVNPSNAANKAVSWTTSDSGAVTVNNGTITAISAGSLPDGLTLSGNVISGTPTASGTFNFTVRAVNGAGSDKKNLYITVGSAPTVTPTYPETVYDSSAGTTDTGSYAQGDTVTYPVTVYDSYARITGAGRYAKGAAVTVNAGIRDGYDFSGWTASGITLANPYSATATFTMPANAVTLTAAWGPVNGYTLKDGIITLDLSDGKINKIIGEAKDKTVIFDFTGNKEATAAVINVNAAQVFANADVSLALKLPNAAVTLSPDALKILAAAHNTGTTPITVEAAAVPMKNLTGMQAAQVRGYETVVNVDVFVGNSKIDLPITVSLPYKLKKNENPAAVCAWHLDGKGNLIKQNGAYNSKTGVFTFTVSRQSCFVTGYDPVTLWVNTFSDVPADAWYYDAIAFANYYGLFTGYSDSIMAPQDNMSRAMFVRVLYKLESNPAPNGAKSFTDVPDGAWYHNAVVWAAENGISSGVGEGTYAPDRAITRQEMVTMLFNYAALKGYEIPQYRIMTFTDNNQIAPWAKLAVALLSEAGVADGDNGAFMPQKAVTRAEAAQMFKNFLRFVGDMESLPAITPIAAAFSPAMEFTFAIYIEKYPLSLYTMRNAFLNANPAARAFLVIDYRQIIRYFDGFCGALPGANTAANAAVGAFFSRGGALFHIAAKHDGSDCVRINGYQFIRADLYAHTATVA